jgi:hypothetical protein
MPYCHQYLKLNGGECLENIIELLATEQFSARGIFQLQNPDHYNIDGSMNDVRAIVDSTENVIRLFCRYSKDVQKISKRVVKFANTNPDLCSAIDNKLDDSSATISFRLTWK